MWRHGITVGWNAEAALGGGEGDRDADRLGGGPELAVAGDHDEFVIVGFLSVADNLKVTTEVISEFANASFHPTIMALFS